MRRTALVLVLLVAALGVVAAGCGGEQDQSATPETVEGGVPTETQTTETETTESETTESETTESETTETGGGAPQGDATAGKAIFLATPPGCTGCHTLSDAGSTATVGPNLDDAKPSYELVYDRVTNGFGGMPPFKDSLTDQQRADVAAYVSSVAGQ